MKLYYCDVVPWAALYIFSHGIFMVYLKCVGCNAGITKKTDVSMAFIYIYKCVCVCVCVCEFGLI